MQRGSAPAATQNAVQHPRYRPERPRRKNSGVSGHFCDDPNAADNSASFCLEKEGESQITIKKEQQLEAAGEVVCMLYDRGENAVMARANGVIYIYSDERRDFVSLFDRSTYTQLLTETAGPRHPNWRELSAAERTLPPLSSLLPGYAAKRHTRFGYGFSEEWRAFVEAQTPKPASSETVAAGGSTSITAVSQSGPVIASQSGPLGTSQSGPLGTSQSGPLSTSQSGPLGTSQSGPLGSVQSGPQATQSIPAITVQSGSEQMDISPERQQMQQQRVQPLCAARVAPPRPRGLRASREFASSTAVVATTSAHPTTPSVINLMVSATEPGAGGTTAPTQSVQGLIQSLQAGTAANPSVQTPSTPKSKETPKPIEVEQISSDSSSEISTSSEKLAAKPEKAPEPKAKPKKMVPREEAKEARPDLPKPTRKPTPLRPDRTSQLWTLSVPTRSAEESETAVRILASNISMAKEKWKQCRRALSDSTVVNDENNVMQSGKTAQSAIYVTSAPSAAASASSTAEDVETGSAAGAVVKTVPESANLKDTDIPAAREDATRELCASAKEVWMRRKKKSSIVIANAFGRITSLRGPDETMSHYHVPAGMEMLEAPSSRRDLRRKTIYYLGRDGYLIDFVEEEEAAELRELGDYDVRGEACSPSGIQAGHGETPDVSQSDLAVYAKPKRDGPCASRHGAGAH